MLHMHFGTGRLGLGLVAPFGQKPGSELYLLNRRVSGSKATGSTHLDAQRRNELLLNNPEKQYVIQSPGSTDEVRETVCYDGFYLYDCHSIQDVTREILAASTGKMAGVVVTASVLTAENYTAVAEALNVICGAKDDGDPIGDVYLIACENTVSARDVFQHEGISGLVSDAPAHSMCPRACGPDMRRAGRVPWRRPAGE